MTLSSSDQLQFGALLLVQSGETASPLPLEHTAVSAAITGGLAQVTVVQRFGNPFDHPVELEYLFPLPHQAAVVDFTLRVGVRRISAAIKETEAARQTYAAASAAGQRAGLLEQRRPNLFALRLANIQPGENIFSEIVYDDRLSFEDVGYTFTFPMGITPRYHSPAHPAPGGRVDAPYVLEDAQIAPVEIRLTLDAGVPISDPTSPSHPIRVERVEGGLAQVALDGRHIPNKDFVLRYEASGKTVQSSLWTHPDGESEAALLTLIPPRLSVDLVVPPREFIFVIDRSGSMSTEPMDQARRALKACLRALNPDDAFTIQAFDHQIEWFYGRGALAVTQEHVDQADRWLDGIKSRGGTEILPAIDAALALPADASRARYLVFLTDGSVSADDAALQKVARSAGRARIFTFGIGPSVNRYLLSKMAEFGRGAAEFISSHEPIEPVVARFQDRVSYPALRDLTLTGQGVDLWDVYPPALPDLYVGQPLEIAARLLRQADHAEAPALTIRGELGGVPQQFSLPLPPGAASELVGRLWARARVESLLDRLIAHPEDRETIRQQVIALGLGARLVTPYTSFVAVDSEVTTGGTAETVLVAQPLPEGLEWGSFVGGGPAFMTMSAPASPPSSMPQLHFMRSRSQPLGSAGSGARDKHTLVDAITPEYERPIAMDEPAGQETEEDLLIAALDQKAAQPHAGRIADILDVAQKPSPAVLQTLASTQRVNGSWDDDPAKTAVRLALFIQAGYTTRAGSYRAQVRKAALWLRAAAPVALDRARGLIAETLKMLSEATGEDWSLTP
ncbi:MAG: VWA domain-containing protein [Anaerolineae bacterium]|nr:VWA domain-containing protein [Anaerolineae bacterium]NUQ03945.1 VWA domain-containing protein [Anaerolineae bacterium]